MFVKRSLSKKSLIQQLRVNLCKQRTFLRDLNVLVNPKRCTVMPNIKRIALDVKRILCDIFLYKTFIQNY